jgi:hypothetical protein
MTGRITRIMNSSGSVAAIAVENDPGLPKLPELLNRVAKRIDRQTATDFLQGYGDKKSVGSNLSAELYAPYITGDTLLFFPKHSSPTMEKIQHVLMEHFRINEYAVVVCEFSLHLDERPQTWGDAPLVVNPNKFALEVLIKFFDDFSELPPYQWFL